MAKLLLLSVSRILTLKKRYYLIELSDEQDGAWRKWALRRKEGRECEVGWVGRVAFEDFPLCTHRASSIKGRTHLSLDTDCC